MVSPTAANDTLTSLLPSTPYTLAYALPLLVMSAVLTFAGSFLTLDRTRVFAPRYDALPGSYEVKKKKGALPGFSLGGVRFLLEGGVGGVCIGFTFGVHLATFLALLVPSVSSSAPLTKTTFLIVWILSAPLTTFLGGRWKYAALGMAGIAGGTLFSLGLSVLIHPPLLARQIFPALLSPLLTVLCILPLALTQHVALRFSTSSIGSFGLTVSIALLANIPQWGNAWQRYWLATGDGWGSGKEGALTAAWVLFTVIGMCVDWALKRWFGECPDEKWDDYLADYTANLPDRAGTYTPFVSVWDRILGAGAGGSKSKTSSYAGSARDIKLPSLTGSSTPTPRSQKTDPFDSNSSASEDDDGTGFRAQPEFLKKKKSGHHRFHARLANAGRSGGKKAREVVKFRPLTEQELLTSSDEEDGWDKMKDIRRPWLKSQPSLVSDSGTLVDAPASASGSDAASSSSKSKKGGGKGGKKAELLKDDLVEEIDYEKEIKKLADTRRISMKGLGEGELPEYSDHETPLGSPEVETKSPKEKKVKEEKVKDVKKEKDWSPGFMKRHKESADKTSSPKSPSPAAAAAVATTNTRTQVQKNRISSGGSQSTATTASTAVDASSSTPVTAKSTRGHRRESAAGTPTTPTTPTTTSPKTKTPVGAVPATPSLIKALDRVGRAQQDAFGSKASLSSPRSPLSASPSTPASSKGKGPAGRASLSLDESPTRGRAGGKKELKEDKMKVVEETPSEIRADAALEGGQRRWDDFWKDVDEKARKR